MGGIVEKLQDCCWLKQLFVVVALNNHDDIGHIGFYGQEFYIS